MDTGAVAESGVAGARAAANGVLEPIAATSIRTSK